ncbi:MAG: AsnC family protein [Acetobacteraceae bacterium]|nr:AsnC family protein [Acetobacteraceae bacterium]
MPKKITWTHAQDTILKRLRAEGASWDEIALAFGYNRKTVIERGNRIGAIKPPPDFVPPPDDLTREPLPAGHPRTWGLLTKGTVLEDEPYPLPFFFR